MTLNNAGKPSEESWNEARGISEFHLASDCSCEEGNKCRVCRLAEEIAEALDKYKVIIKDFSISQKNLMEDNYTLKKEIEYLKGRLGVVRIFLNELIKSGSAWGFSASIALKGLEKLGGERE